MTEVTEIRLDLQRMTRELEGLRDSMSVQEMAGWLVHYPMPMELSEAVNIVVAETPADNHAPMPIPAWPVIFLIVQQGSVSINDRRVLHAGQSELIADLTGQAFVRALDHPTKIFLIAPKAEVNAGEPKDDTRAAFEARRLDGTPRSQG